MAAASALCLFLTVVTTTASSLFAMTRATPANMAKAIAPDVAVSNVQFTGNGACARLFHGGSSLVRDQPFPDGGLVLSSGKPNFLKSAAAGRGGGSALGDYAADLTAAILGYAAFTATSQDACVLQFDFYTEYESKLAFNYVFGSGQYDEWASTGDDHAFALLLNGANVALLPGTDTAVSPRTVNNRTNAAYYNNNAPRGDDGGGSSSSGEEAMRRAYPALESNGFTKMLGAEAVTKPGKNHVVLAVVDASYHGYDSWVLLEAGSFRLNPACRNVRVDVSGGSGTLDPGDVLVGSCPGCELTLDRTHFFGADAGNTTVTLNVTDSYGTAGSCTVTATAYDANEAEDRNNRGARDYCTIPSVDAGGDYIIFLQGSTDNEENGFLDGAVADANNNDLHDPSLKTLWTTDCENAIFDNASALGTFLTFPQGTVPQACNLTLTATSEACWSSTVMSETTKVYVVDPTAGTVTGRNLVMGNATINFAAKYGNRGMVPTGTTEFVVSGDTGSHGDRPVRFRSNHYRYLMVAAGGSTDTKSCARFGGVGVFNGVGYHRFTIAACNNGDNDNDTAAGELSSSSSSSGGATRRGGDTLRIKIWRAWDSVVVYDNWMGTQDDDGYGGTPIDQGNVEIQGKGLRRLRG